jgi:hypothetical protein
MAYKRKWSGSQSQKSSKAKFSKKGGQKSRKLPLAVKVARLARDIRPEMKLGLVYNNAAQAGTVGTYDAVGIWNAAYNNWYISNWPLAAMVEGDDEAQRVGRKIRLKYVDFSFYASQQANSHNAITLSFELVQYKLYAPGNYGTPPNINNLYDQDSNGAVSTVSFRDIDYRKNWRILYKTMITVPADNYSTQVRYVTKQFRAVMPKGGLDILFAGKEANTLTSPAIFVIIRSSFGNISPSVLTGVNFNYCARIRYTDV